MNTPDEAREALHARLLARAFDALFVDDRGAHLAQLADELAQLTADGITAEPDENAALRETLRDALGG